MLSYYHRGRFFVMGRRLDGSFGKIDVVDLDRVSQAGWLTEMLVAITDPQVIDTPHEGASGRLEFKQEDPTIIREPRKSMTHTADFRGGQEQL